jgi:hypothetical protein
MRGRLLLCVSVCAACLALVAPGALASKPRFHPRVGPGLGLFPPFTMQNGRFTPTQSASQPLTPVTYHGGKTMTGGVTIHTIFWTGGTHPFQGKPPGAPHNYIGMIKQYLLDVAHDSTGTSGGTCTKSECNGFTVEAQYGWGTTPGGITHGQYTVRYNPAADSFIDLDRYPKKSQQCASPQDVAVCITDAEVQAEVDRVISVTGGKRGLHDIWYVFTPPGVDECISPGVCESNAYGGYHSVSDLGHGPTIYAYTGDPIVESRTVTEPGNDPEGYPDAEHVIDIVAHEVNEAMTDPEGVGYMDPNGFEIGDKCEFGPQFGTPLGFAPDGSPYNQVVDGHKYLIQEMWANRDNSNNPDCVRATKNTSNPLPLPEVFLRQFSSMVAGNTENNASGVTVKVTLLRASSSGAPVVVAHGTGTTSNGAWSVSLAPHAVGDDRDVIEIHYSGAGAPSPRHEQVLTGSGGNPFTESGWIGFTDMDHGSFLTDEQTEQGFPPPSLTLEPCFQTGLESDSLATESPTDFCNTSSDAATVPLSSPVTPGQAVTWSSLDDRAFTPPGEPNANLIGALVKLTVRVGEPDSVSTFSNPFVAISPGGFPTCSGDLEARTVACSGLVAGATYTLHDGSKSASGAADSTGTVSVSLAIRRGDTVSLSNGSRTLTVLHVAHLRVAIKGNQATVASGQCQAGEYYGPPVSSPPTNGSAGSPAGGIALSGEICPLSGSAAGLPSGTIAQTDEFSGGQTQTEVPLIVRTTPVNGQDVPGTFTALARAGFPGPNNTTTHVQAPIALQIRHAGAPVFNAKNVDSKNGVKVSGLKSGVYEARWTLTDANGDSRTLFTEFTVR